MAQYMILIYGDESSVWNSSPESRAEMFERHGSFATDVVEQGAKILHGDALQLTSTATSIRGDVVTDGPFAETKEALGGYYVIEADDLDQALAVAKLCPAPSGGVEVRPVMDTSAP